MATVQEPGTYRLFGRWMWLVYLPLSLFVAALALAFTDALPRWGIPVLLVLSIWGALAVRLLFEKLQRGVHAPPPRGLLTGFTWVAGLAVAGALFTWIGLANLSTNPGFGLAMAGVFLLLVSGLAPLFKILDLALRGLGKLAMWLIRRRRPSPALARAQSVTAKRQDESTSDRVLERTASGLSERP